MKAPKEHFGFNFKIAFGVFQCNLDCFGGLLDFNSGGKKVIERLVEAYGFTTRQALCDHLGVSKSTMATRYMRDIFPADWVLQCAMETGSSIEWLAFGNGIKPGLAKTDTVALPKLNINEGRVEDGGFTLFDTSLLPEYFQMPAMLAIEGKTYLIEQQFKEITDGDWLVEIEGAYSIRSLTRIPIGKLKVENSSTSFECSLTDIKPIGKCVFKVMVKI